MMLTILGLWIITMLVIGIVCIIHALRPSKRERIGWYTVLTIAIIIWMAFVFLIVPTAKDSMATSVFPWLSDNYGE